MFKNKGGETREKRNEDGQKTEELMKGRAFETR